MPNSTSCSFVTVAMLPKFTYITDLGLSLSLMSLIPGIQSTTLSNIGTPEEMLSIVEPHPLCVRKPPIEGWLRTSSCGHQLQIKLLSFVSSVYSGGNIAESPATISGLIIHRNGWQLSASPMPNSTSCSFVTVVM
uniref:Uncharacterized protein n=2 Tax=Salix viminalis TaxID=40686 RepID=A0A6N2JZ91_SALVM